LFGELAGILAATAQIKQIDSHHGIMRSLLRSNAVAEGRYRMPTSPLKHFDWWSVVVIVLTFVLFALALFIKGLTHEVLLEAGVFLVSLKLILMSHKNSVLAENLAERLDEIQQAVRRTGRE
jgi:hypothetical protein